MKFLSKKYIPSKQDAPHISWGVGRNPLVPVDTPLNFMSWNIYKANRANCAETLAGYLKEFDFLVLQEWITNEKLNHFYKSPQFKNYSWNFYPTFTYSKNHSLKTGICNVSRYVSHLNEGHLSKNVESFIKTPKIFSSQYYEIRNYAYELLIINIHGLNLVSKASFRSQIDQLYSLAKYHIGPAIIAGDFNATSKHDYGYMMEKLHDLGQFKINFKGDPRKKKHRDFIFHNALINPLKKKVIDDLETSDHRPLFMQFTVTNLDCL